MKQGWEIKKLGDVCEIMNGGTPDTTVPKFWDGENLWITPKDMGKMKSIYVDDTLRKITEEGLKNSSAKILPINSIILSSRAPIGHLAINTKPISTNQGCKGLVPKKGISTLYIYYFLSKSVDLLNSLGTGATFKELSGSKLGDIEIPLPPLPEQQRIVAILDEAFAAIAKAKTNAEQNLKNAKQLFESYLQSIFENKGEVWEEKKLGEVCEELFAGGDVPKNDSFKFKTDDYSIPIFSNGEKNKGLYGYTNVARVTKPSITISARGTIGYSEIRNEHFYPAIRLIVVTPKKEFINLAYLKYVISGIDFKHSGSSIPQLTVPMIKEYPISFPSIKEQQTIVKKLDALSTETKKLETIYQNKIQDLEELKKSILQKAFAGELKVDNGELKMKKKLSAV
ncbi:MAG: restriction endonuclease subunit S [Bacteroidota bacterium]